MEKRKILIQLDSDAQPSVFDRVVAVDAGADEVFAYGGVKPEQVQGLVHGAIFTRGAKDLKSTAIFVGGSDVAAGERLLQEARKHMIPQFGLCVSILLDANGANTTAAAAVRAAGRHLDLKNAPALVLGGTGPVGQRVAPLAGQGGSGGSGRFTSGVPGRGRVCRHPGQGPRRPSGSRGNRQRRPACQSDRRKSTGDRGGGGRHRAAAVGRAPGREGFESGHRS